MIVAIIPARGGSKGLHRKNIVPFAGKPLIVWTIQDAQQSRLIDEVIVSTDNREISKISHNYGATTIKRPRAISGDHSPSEEALIHVLSKLIYDDPLIVFLQATSPLRREGDLDKAIDRLLKSDADCLLSIAECHRFIWVNGKPINYDPYNRPMRQNINQFVETGSFYILKSHVLESGSRLAGKIVTFETPWWASFEIDTEEDLGLLEFLMEKYHV